MKKVIICLAFAFTVCMLVTTVSATFKGYDYKARIFIGSYETWAMAEYGWSHDVAEAWCNQFKNWAHDREVMKWNAEWDRGMAENWANPPYDAWKVYAFDGRGPCYCLEDGKVEGSGEMFHYKVIWVGYEGSEYWHEGGAMVWGQFEIIIDHASWADRTHEFLVKARPCGVGTSP